MNKISEWAEKLNGREYGGIISSDENAQAEKDGVVIVSGYSDDLMEFEGAISDELYCSEGGTVYLDEKGLLFSRCSDPDRQLTQEKKERCRSITAVWCGADRSAAWTYDTDIPHETFNIYDEGKLCCVGIVFSLEDLSVEGAVQEVGTREVAGI